MLRHKWLIVTGYTTGRNVVDRMSRTCVTSPHNRRPPFSQRTDLTRLLILTSSDSDAARNGVTVSYNRTPGGELNWPLNSDQNQYVDSALAVIKQMLEFNPRFRAKSPVRVRSMEGLDGTFNRD